MEKTPTWTKRRLINNGILKKLWKEKTLTRAKKAEEKNIEFIYKRIGIFFKFLKGEVVFLRHTKRDHILIHTYVHTCNRRCRGDVCGPWGKGSHLGSRGSQRTRPAQRGKRRAVGIRQWRRIDVTECIRTKETGSPQHQATFMHRVCIIVIMLITTSTTITGIVFDCLICFRRINHLVVKNHLHSSSGIREVVSSTIHIPVNLLSCSLFCTLTFFTGGTFTSTFCESSQHFCHWTLCPNRHLLYSTIISVNFFYYTTFCPVRRYCHRSYLLSLLITIWRFVLSTFFFTVQYFSHWPIFPSDVLSVDVFYPRCFLLQHFVGESFKVIPLKSWGDFICPQPYCLR